MAPWLATLLTNTPPCANRLKLCNRLPGTAVDAAIAAGGSYRHPCLAGITFYMTEPTWGYERPDCIGNNALALFIDDIQRILDHYGQMQGAAETRLFQAQAAANKLLKAYETNARRTTAFHGQFIEIKSVSAMGSAPQWVPLFSPGLKQALKTLLDRSNDTPTH